MNLNPARKPTESMTAYRRRRAAENKMVKNHLRYPVLIFSSSRHGNYNKLKHGPIGQDRRRG